MKRLDLPDAGVVDEVDDPLTLMLPGHEGHSHRVQLVEEMLVLRCEHDCLDMLDQVCYCCGKDCRFL